jgi:O-antigen/teichoic acid export membrane protein
MTLGFSLPLVPGAFIEAGLSVLDRFVLEKFVPLREVGLYSLARNLAGVLRQLSSALKTAWIPFYMRVATERSDYAQVISRTTTLYSGVLASLSVLLAIMAREIILFMGKEAYLDAAALVPLLVLALYIQIHDVILGNGLLMARKTGYMPLIIAVQGIVYVVSSLLLVPRLGALGAVFSLMIGSIVRILVQGWFSLRFYPIPFEFRKLAMLPLLAILAYGSSSIVHSNSITIFAISFKILILLVYTVCVMRFILGIRLHHLAYVVPASIRERFSTKDGRNA